MENTEPDPQNGITDEYDIKQFGLFTVITARSFVKNDTVASVHFAGQYDNNATCLYLTDFGNSLSYSGSVKLVGEKKLSSEDIRALYIDSKPNLLTLSGGVSKSLNYLPEINNRLEDAFQQNSGVNSNLANVEKINDSLYFNSFFNETKNINISGSVLSNVNIKGNIVLYSADSVYIKNTVHLEDVIIRAPIIVFEDGFKGTVQALATKRLQIGKNSEFLYPSGVTIFNDTLDESTIIIGENTKILGNIILFGFPDRALDNNSIDIDKGGYIVGDIYCKGKLMLKSDVFGSVYTNKLSHKTAVSNYENCLADVEINSKKRPSYFIGVQVFNEKEEKYGLIKRLL
ncbi:polymer-forming cytoskeletal protein [Flavobacterium zepuense]|uniref:Polymer-forming cytoskeletal protein n=1 Tax=Flavobacterium zepuense TaxID=2593302 RepID=A0A552VAN5_9FLAO|nr:polymer-forming cytoskeletal protein [Flavobacterium zepuense]TRW27543.1 polymer-forming cytoskeletal protein [Flavobacterium zepuense]